MDDCSAPAKDELADEPPLTISSVMGTQSELKVIKMEMASVVNQCNDRITSDLYKDSLKQLHQPFGSKNALEFS